MTKEEAKKFIAKSKAAKGVTAQSTNGQFYFLSDEEAQKTEIPAGSQRAKLLLEIFKKKAGSGGAVTLAADDFCDDLGDYLLKSSIFSEGWEELAKLYLSAC